MTYIAPPDVQNKTEAKTEDKSKEYEGLEKQAQAEYRLAYDYLKPKIAEWLVRLKLYNNQRRDKTAVGDTTLFSIMQTVIASLYMDTLQIQFDPREPGDEDIADNLTIVAENDYEEMGKDELDYTWIWDACFFGRSLMLLSEYIRDPEQNIYLPVPEVIDPATFLRDPKATSVNGNRNGKGAARFFGRELRMTKKEMIENKNFFNTNFDEIKFVGNESRSLVDDAEQARADAQGKQYNRNSAEKSLGANAEYSILEWWTHYEIDGQVKKVKCWFANGRKKLVGMQVLKHDYWPIIDRPLYPTSNDWEGTSIPDLIEDKQRARAIVQNLGLEAMKADLHPMYVYNTNAVKNRNDLNFGFDKFIPVDGQANNQIVPMQKAFPNMQLLNFVFETLDASAQKATASPDLKQGVTPTADRTLGENNLVVGESNNRYSLSAKIFGWSEKRFWRQWYQCYKDYFQDDIDEKVVRLTGALAGKWRKLRKDQLVAKIDPDVKVDSLNLSRSRQAEKRNLWTGYFGVALSDPDANRRWGLMALGELNGMKRDELNMLFPPTIDELEARDENDKLTDNKFVPVLKDQNHNVHLVEHTKAGDSDQKYAHIKTHEAALKVKRTNPEFFPPDPAQTQLAQPNGQPGQGSTPAPGGAPTAQPVNAGLPQRTPPPPVVPTSLKPQLPVGH